MRVALRSQTPGHEHTNTTNGEDTTMTTTPAEQVIANVLQNITQHLTEDIGAYNIPTTRAYLQIDLDTGHALKMTGSPSTDGTELVWFACIEYPEDEGAPVDGGARS